MNASNSDHSLGVSTMIEAIDNRQYLVGAALMNQVDSALTVQQSVSRIEPDTRFFGRIKFRQPIYSIAEI